MFGNLVPVLVQTICYQTYFFYYQIIYYENYKVLQDTVCVSGTRLPNMKLMILCIPRLLIEAWTWNLKCATNRTNKAKRKNHNGQSCW